MRKNTVWIYMAALAIGSFNIAVAGEKEDFYTLDYRYKPPLWRTSICLVDDPQKTLVMNSGAMIYDLHEYQACRERTSISAELAEGTKWIGQDLYSPRVPLLRTRKKHGDIQILEEAFAVAPSINKSAIHVSIERIDGKNGNSNWAKPSAPCIDGFRNIALAESGQVIYRFRANDTARYQVVFGLCEGYWSESGKRLIDLKIEGKTKQKVDMVAEYGKNVPAVFSFEARDEDGDGWITLTSVCAKDAPDDNAILNCLWVFPADSKIAKNDIIAGAANEQAIHYLDCFADKSLHPTRDDILLVRLRNTGDIERTVQPKIVIKSKHGIAVNSQNTVIGGITKVTCTATYTHKAIDGGAELMLEPVALPAKAEYVYALDITTGEPCTPIMKDLADAIRERKKSIAYWEAVDIPYDCITVPDKNVQGLLDSCIRNIYQAREIKDGLPAFQVGPGIYRGMWVVDGAFITESVSFLGRLEEARHGIHHLMSFQQPDGSFLIIPEHWKETGIMIWVMYHHARLSGDKAWLNEVWPKLEKCVSFIKHMRYNMCSDPKSPNYHLIPNGLSDGGLGGSYPEYTNIYWNLIGMKAAVDAAKWLGKNEQREEWQAEYDNFNETFQKAAHRDMKPDANGNLCLPIRMVDDQNVPPQKGQWACMHAIYPGMVLEKNDPIVTGNMAMLKAAELEGLVFNTGWKKNGLWGYFGSFYAHAWLWIGESEKAAKTLYAFANHAAPTMIWCEEHMPQGKGAAICGDMPHNWASAEFIRLVRHVMVLERGNDMHLLEAVPKTWIYPGAVIELRDIVTEFGPISLDFCVSEDGKAADLNFKPSFREAPARCILHLDSWSEQKGHIELPQEGKRVTIELHK